MAAYAPHAFCALNFKGSLTCKMWRCAPLVPSLYNCLLHGEIYDIHMHRENLKKSGGRIIREPIKKALVKDRKTERVD